ncbi:MAG: CDP-diacylglycerol--glycerol-3-phosphate 3-phosphatidyltransferase [Myxococcota bacterium]
MWTIPNMLSLGRLAVVPFIVALIWPGIESRTTCFWAMAIYAVGGLTDVFDGMLARRINQVTVLGKFLDPLSDKLFYLITMIALLQLQGPRIPFWVVMVVLTRELAITGLRTIAMSEGIVIAAGEAGKMKTLAGSLGMLALLIHYPYMINFGFFSAIIDFHIVGLWVTYISVALSLTSGVDYMRGFFTAARQRSAPS